MPKAKKDESFVVEFKVQKHMPSEDGSYDVKRMNEDRRERLHGYLDCLEDHKHAKVEDYELDGSHGKGYVRFRERGKSKDVYEYIRFKLRFRNERAYEKVLKDFRKKYGYDGVKTERDKGKPKQ